MRVVDWQPVREAFVQRPARQIYEDLAAEFAVSVAGIARCSAEEGWPALRARYMESQLHAADASSVLLSVVRGDRTVTTAYLALAVVTLATLQATVEKVRDSGKAESTIADVVNTCTFAAKNMADALRSVGIIGAGKLLADGGKEDNGRWNPQMLSQINLTVQNLVSQAGGKPVDPPTAAPAVVPSAPDKPAPVAGSAPIPSEIAYQRLA